jgi:hypothetical protein
MSVTNRLQDLDLETLEYLRLGYLDALKSTPPHFEFHAAMLAKFHAVCSELLVRHETIRTDAPIAGVEVETERLVNL